jgi:hypothetical protein
MRGQSLRFGCLAMLCWFGMVPSSQAQALFGSVVGNVRDPSVAAVAGVRVTLTNAETQQVREAITTDTGAYDFATVPPGTYEVRAAREGFAASVRNGIVVSPITRCARISSSVSER